MIQLIPGTYYRTRDGRKALVAEHCRNPERYRGFLSEPQSKAVLTWEPDGSAYGVGTEGLDLVAVWKPLPAAPPKESMETTSEIVRLPAIGTVRLRRAKGDDPLTVRIHEWDGISSASNAVIEVYTSTGWLPIPIVDG